VIVQNAYMCIIKHFWIYRFCSKIGAICAHAGNIDIQADVKWFTSFWWKLLFGFDNLIICFVHIAVVFIS